MLLTIPLPVPMQGILILALGSVSFVAMALWFKNRALHEEGQELSPRQLPPPAQASFRPLKVLDIITETRRSSLIKSFILASAEPGAPLPTWRAGQFINFKIHDEPRTTRSYSISACSWGSYAPNTLQITIKKLPQGHGSTWFHSLNVGDIIYGSTPMGHFYDDWAADLRRVYIAGGIGITPLIAMIQAQSGHTNPAQMHLFYSAQSVDELVFHQLLTHLARRQHFHYHPFISQPPEAGGAGEPGLITPGRITVARIMHTLGLATSPPGDQYVFFLCGPQAMMNQLTSELGSHGVPPQHIITEAFSQPSSIDPTTLPPVQAQVRFAGETYTYHRTQDLLSFLEDHGHALPYGCRSGVCGTCAVTLQGKAISIHQPPADLEAAGNSAARSSRRVFSCICYPLGDITVSRC